MSIDPENTYRELLTQCLTIRDVWEAVIVIPPDDVDPLLAVALRHALAATEDPSIPEEQQRRALHIVDVICDRVLYVMMGVPRSPDAAI